MDSFRKEYRREILDYGDVAEEPDATKLGKSFDAYVG